MSVSADTSDTRGAATPFSKGRSSPDRGKRVFDFVGAAACLLFILPVLAAIAIAVKAFDGGRIIYSHRRIGRGGRSFGCLKFRTMVENGDEVLAAHIASDPVAAIEWAETRKLRNDPRITPIGRLLRKFSLDELPQFVNVLKGDMSMVGPRPIVADELAHYGGRSHLYCRVRPGVTGLWQINGRNELSYDERVELDCRYVQEHRLATDMAIILKTIPAVCTARGSS